MGDEREQKEGTIRAALTERVPPTKTETECLFIASFAGFNRIRFQGSSDLATRPLSPKAPLR